MASAVDGTNPHRPLRNIHLRGAHGDVDAGAESPSQPSWSEPPDAYARVQSSRGPRVGVASQAAPVDALMRDLASAANWRELPSQFAADFRSVRAQLIQLPGLSSVDKAERMFAFFAGYAERFLSLAPPDSPSRQFALQQFLAEMEGLGYGALSEAMTNQSALHVAQRLLSSRSTEEFLSHASRLHFVAQHSALSSPPDAGAQRGPEEPRRDLPPPPSSEAGEVPPLPERRPTSPEVGASKDRDRGASWTGKVLGPNLLWNVLHRSRAEEVEDGREDDRRLERLGLVALVTLAGIVVLVACLILLM